MGIHYDTSTDADATMLEIEHKIEMVRSALKNLQAVKDVLESSVSGDAEFDVEITTSINVARASLLRWQTMLRENSGKIKIDLSEAADCKVKACEMSL